MNFKQLQRALKQEYEITPLHGSACVGGERWDVMGILHNEDQASLCLMIYDAAQWEEEPRPMSGRCRTRRAKILSENQFSNDLGVHMVQRVTIGDQTYDADGIETTGLQDIDANDLVGLMAFLCAGYMPHEEILNRSFDALRLSAIRLKGAAGNRIDAENASVVLDLRKGWEHRPVRKRMKLSIGEGSARPYTLTDRIDGSQHHFYINRVYLFDPWANMERRIEESIEKGHPAENVERIWCDMSEALEPLCSRGWRLPVVEYEAEEGISLEFFAHDELNEPPCSSDSGAASIGVIFMNSKRNMGPHGYALQETTIRCAVSPDTEVIDAEMLRYALSAPAKRVVME